MSTKESEVAEQRPTLDQFAEQILVWQAQKMAELNHMLSIPEGTRVSLNAGESVVLEGEAMKAYRAGVSLAMVQFDKLPFSVEFETDSTELPLQSANAH